VNVLAQFFVSRSSRPAIRIREKPNGTGNIETCTQKAGKALGCVHGNVVEPVQLIDDHQLDQLIECERLALGLAVARSIGLVDQTTTESHIYHRRLAKSAVLRDRLDALALQRASKAGTRDAIEGEIEHQEVMLQQDFCKRAEMALGICIADAEVGFGLYTERVREQIVGPKQHVFLETFDVDLEEIELGNQAFGKKRVQTTDRHRAGLFAR